MHNIPFSKKKKKKKKEEKKENLSDTVPLIH